jgi:inorganic pyrophosphatase
MDFPAVTGCVVNARLIGYMRAKQEEKDKRAVRNDRFIAVARDSRILSDVRSLPDLRSGLMEEITAFFVQYNNLAGKRFEPLGNCDAKKALLLVKHGIKKVGKKR